MKPNKAFETVLPSNRKFGFFFTAVFLIASAYFYMKTNPIGYYTLGGPLAVGKSSTKSVVYSCIVILIMNFILTQLMLA